MRSRNCSYTACTAFLGVLFALFGAAFALQQCWFSLGREPYRSPVLPRRGHDRTQRLPAQHRKRRTELFFNWFSGKSSENRDGNAVSTAGDSISAAATSASMGGVAGTMASMENFQRSQRAGKLTRKLVQDLASTTVEGIAADGKVKVVVDGQQRPVSVDIDENYLDNVECGDLCRAITLAMNEAHAKSIERMDEKMKSLYSELGLPSS